jgi:hypothetical protein
MAIALPAAPTNASSLGKICNRIADELVRPDLRASHIPLAVNDAVKEAATDRFWFNELRGLTFTTVPGQIFYNSADAIELGYLSDIDTIWLIINGQRRNMELANALNVNNWLEGQMTLTGEPCSYARYNDGILLWMVPRLAWTVYIDGTTSFAPLLSDTDTNAFLDQGERYIRALAKAHILEDVIRDYDHADRQWTLAEREKKMLLKETGGLAATNRMAASL